MKSSPMSEFVARALERVSIANLRDIPPNPADVALAVRWKKWGKPRPYFHSAVGENADGSIRYVYVMDDDQ